MTVRNNHHPVLGGIVKERQPRWRVRNGEVVLKVVLFSVKPSRYIGIPWWRRSVSPPWRALPGNPLLPIWNSPIADIQNFPNWFQDPLGISRLDMGVPKFLSWSHPGCFNSRHPVIQGNLPLEADSACKYRLPKSGDTGGGTSVLASLWSRLGWDPTEARILRDLYWSWPIARKPWCLLFTEI